MIDSKEPTVTIPVSHYDALESRIAELESNQSWIRVEDELPHPPYVLAYRPTAPQFNRISTLQYDSHMKRWSGNFPVTHWMPLPEPPMEGE
jgi:hypothetical protein